MLHRLTFSVCVIPEVFGQLMIPTFEILVINFEIQSTCLVVIGDVFAMFEVKIRCYKVICVFNYQYKGR